MMLRTALRFIFLMIASTGAGSLFAQQFVRGRIYDKKKDRVLASVSVHNYSTKAISQSDFGGNYKIDASVDDLLIFSSVSYLPDTIRVTAFMLNNTFDISMDQSPELLESVTVGGYNNYQLDSLARREDYEKFYESKKSKLIDKSPSGDPGFKISPITYYSKNEKQKRKLLERLQYNEEQYYIDFRFAPTFVSRLTGLTSDSLHTFMLRYRPTYKWARKSDQEDMLLYVNDKFREYKKKLGL